MEILLVILSILYAGTGVVATIGYFPTIKDLSKKIESANIYSYIIWTSCAFITFLYAVYIVMDILLQIVTGINFLSCAVILTMAVRIKYLKKKS